MTDQTAEPDRPAPSLLDRALTVGTWAAGAALAFAALRLVDVV